MIFPCFPSNFHVLLKRSAQAQKGQRLTWRQGDSTVCGRQGRPGKWQKWLLRSISTSGDALTLTWHKQLHSYQTKLSPLIWQCGCISSDVSWPAKLNFATCDREQNQLQGHAKHFWPDMKRQRSKSPQGGDLRIVMSSFLIIWVSLSSNNRMVYILDHHRRDSF